MSIDTGMSGNLFGGHYFDMNESHLKGQLKKIETSFKKLERGGPDNASTGYSLKIHPLSKKKKRKSRDISEALVDEHAKPVKKLTYDDYDENGEIK